MHINHLSMGEGVGLGLLGALILVANRRLGVERDLHSGGDGPITDLERGYIGAMTEQCLGGIGANSKWESIYLKASFERSSCTLSPSPSKVAGSSSKEMFSIVITSSVPPSLRMKS